MFKLWALLISYSLSAHGQISRGKTIWQETVAFLQSIQVPITSSLAVNGLFVMSHTQTVLWLSGGIAQAHLTRQLSNSAQVEKVAENVAEMDFLRCWGLHHLFNPLHVFGEVHRLNEQVRKPGIADSLRWLKTVAANISHHIVLAHVFWEWWLFATGNPKHKSGSEHKKQRGLARVLSCLTLEWSI